MAFANVVKAKERGAKVIHVDPHFSRTSALANLYVPTRAGGDIVFLGAIIRHLLEKGGYFHEYVVNYTNAATLIREDYRDTEDLGPVDGGVNRFLRGGAYIHRADGVRCDTGHPIGPKTLWDDVGCRVVRTIRVDR